MGTCKSGLLGCLVVVLGLAGCGGSGEEAGGDGARPAAAGVVHVYNWSDYIAEDTIPGFERETGIKVTYGMFDSNELLEAKLLAGGSGFDVVVPSLQFLGRQIQAGVFQPLDKSRLENYSGLDPALMERIAIQDPGNQYAVPYLWGTTGIGYNVEQITKRMPDAELNSLSLVFDPENAKKLASCGIYLLDTPYEIVPLALLYNGLDPQSAEDADLEKAFATLEAIRPYVKKFHSSEFISAMANGEACLTVGYSGDLFLANARSKAAGNTFEIKYMIPKEGARLSAEQCVIFENAKHKDAAYQFINFMLDAKNNARAANYVEYSTSNLAAHEFINPHLLKEEALYPSDEECKKLIMKRPYTLKEQKKMTKMWIKLKDK